MNHVPLVPPDRIAFGLLGFCCDEGIRRNLGRPGAAQGPAAIRRCLAKLPVQKRQHTYYDAGDITCTDENLEEAQQALGEAVALLIKNNIIPIVLGGGHELAWGHYQGIAQVFPHRNLGIVNFDAHFDMRPLLSDEHGSSGTPFLQIAKTHESNKRRFDYNCIGIQQAGNISELFDTANHYNVQTILADDIHLGKTERCYNLINRTIFQNQSIYISLCLDVFSVAYAPGVSAPQTLGLSPWQVIPFLRYLAASGKLISYDIAELSPPYDSDQRTAMLAAQMIREITQHHTLHTSIG